jgi:hypothetical protein
MKKILLLIAVVIVVACEATPIVFPDPTGGNGSTTSSGATMGAGGDGSGLSCDPCENTDGTRLARQRKVVSSSDGLRDVSAANYWDKLRNEACTPYPDSNGATRCFPTSDAFGSNRFGDTACSQPLVYTTTKVCGGSIPKYAGGLGITSTPCVQATYSIFAVGEPFVGPMYAESNGTCAEAQPSYNGDYYFLGPAIPATEFAEINTEFVH